ncbi:EpsG family protein [Mesonia sp. K7]|uniref:EpsG family protein n=1 Tax=Mesonia sp. K7 TaxID=2218606 RepID=UPI000DAA0177|nr:EpsG family protein [Mesonia sp. K7]PZD76611.1 hypothetical protein DNG35_11515 [Mesonia sp. K7]
MNSWQSEEKTDQAIKIILFLISPFIATFYALRNLKTRSSFLIFFLFAVFFGMSFTVDLGKNESSSFDGASYREKFERYIYYYNETDFITSLDNFLYLNEGAKDYYFFSLSYFVSQITNNYHVLFMVIAIVFAFFALKSLKFLVLEKNFQTNFGGFVLLSLFMINDIFNINGVRFWTAAWVGVYCIFQIFRNNNKKYFLLAAITPFIHVAFWIFLVVMIGAYFSKKTSKPWIILFFISFLVSNISVELVRGLINILPPVLANMAEAYTDQGYLAEQQSKGSGFIWVTEIFRFLVKLYMNVMVALFIHHANTISANPKTKKLFSFLLIWMTFVNFTTPIPSLGGRFMVMAYPIIAYIWLVNFYGKKYQRLLYLMPFVFVMFFYVKVILYKGVTDLSFYVSSPVYLIYKHIL